MAKRKKTPHASSTSAPDGDTAVTSEKKVTFSSPIVTSRKTFDSSGSGSSNSQDDDATEGTQKQHKRSKARVKVHRDETTSGSIKNADDKDKDSKGKEVEPSAKSKMGEKPAKTSRSRSRLNAQTLAMLLKLVDKEEGEEEVDDDGSSPDSSSSSSDRNDSHYMSSSSSPSSSSASSSSDDDGQDEQQPVRKSALKNKKKNNKEKKKREHKTRHDPYIHDDDTAGSNASHNIALVSHTDLDMKACGTLTAAYADMYPDRTKLYATTFRNLDTPAHGTAATAAQGLATGDCTTAERVVTWTQQDCDCLSLLEARQRALKWLDLQAQFYNVTGKMVSAEVIKDKFEEDAQRTRETRETRETMEMKEDGRLGEEEKTNIEKREAGESNKVHKKALKNQDSKERLGTSIGGAYKVMTETDDMMASALKKLLKLKQ